MPNYTPPRPRVVPMPPGQGEHSPDGFEPGPFSMPSEPREIITPRNNPGAPQPPFYPPFKIPPSSPRDPRVGR